MHIEPGRDRYVKLHEGRYWNVTLCTGVGSSVGMDVTDG